MRCNLVVADAVPGSWW